VEPIETQNITTDNQYEVKFKADYESDWAIHSQYVEGFDSYEAMLLGYVYDSVSGSIDSSKITDSYAATLAIERAARVVGKLPDGTTESIGTNDEGKAAFMDILRQKWVYPNANCQHPFQTKLRLWQLYSSVYGYMPMFYDWNVSNTGYMGPDCWLWNPRNLVPQQGRVSITDMDYVTALTYVSKKYLQGILDKEPDIDEEIGEPLPFDDGWDREAIQELVNQNEKKNNTDRQRDTLTTRTRTPSGTKKGICLATRYEAGEDGQWITFAPENSYIELRRIDNPHKNGKIPFVIKYSQPLFDSFYGMGEFQRAKPLQFARDGLTNFYFKGIKMSLIRPIVANANGVMKHTLDYREGAVMLETIPNSIRTLDVGNGGLSTYQGAMSALTGSLLSQNGSQNASLPGADSLNPSQGKTPQAIDLYTEKEATRDGQERAYLESAIEELTDGFNSLLVNIGTEDIPINLFMDDIQDIQDAGLDDVMEMFTQVQPNEMGGGATLTINPEVLKGVEYRFNIEPNSTAKISKEKQRQSLVDFMSVIGKMQNVIQQDPNTQVGWGQILKTYSNLTGLPGADKFITVQQGPTQKELALQQQVQELQSQVQGQQPTATQPAMPQPQPTEQPQSQALNPPTMSAPSSPFQDPYLSQAAAQFMR
jgi:hypothetical protein